MQNAHYFRIINLLFPDSSSSFFQIPDSWQVLRRRPNTHCHPEEANLTSQMYLLLLVLGILSTKAQRSPPFHIIHIGAHVGNDPTLFWVVEHGATATLLEPDHNNARVLRETYKMLGKGEETVEIIEGVAGCPPGKDSARFWSGSEAQMR